MSAGSVPTVCLDQSGLPGSILMIYRHSQMVLVQSVILADYLAGSTTLGVMDCILLSTAVCFFYIFFMFFDKPLREYSGNANKTIKRLREGVSILRMAKAFQK